MLTPKSYRQESPHWLSKLPIDPAWLQLSSLPCVSPEPRSQILHQSLSLETCCGRDFSPSIFRDLRPLGLDISDSNVFTQNPPRVATSRSTMTTGTQTILLHFSPLLFSATLSARQTKRSLSPLLALRILRIPMTVFTWPRAYSGAVLSWDLLSQTLRPPTPSADGSTNRNRVSNDDHCHFLFNGS